MGVWMSVTTGIFFHYQRGERLRDFPQALADVLARPNVLFFDALYPTKPVTDFDIEPITLETLMAVHTRKMVSRVMSTDDFDGALYSASGTVAAANHVATGKLTNAFVFTGFGDHHAGSDFFGGGCYFNGAAIAIRQLRDRLGMIRFAIIDTDAHHGDGTWELFQDDPDVLYICFCNRAVKDINENWNVQVPYRVDDASYMAMVKHVLENRVKAFEPEIVFWNWGYDGTRGDYGDLGLSPMVHFKLTIEIRKTAHTVCKGRLVVVLCGGHRRDLARELIPSILRILSD